MPPFRQPQTLNTLCLKVVNQLIVTSCVNIDKKYVNYDDEECIEEVNSLQEYLLSKIPGLVLNEVYLFTKCECQSFPKGNRKIGLLLSRVYMHKSMKQLDATRYRPNTHGQSSESRSQVLHYEQFWIFHLPKLKNLVDLNLHLLCTDAILEVVGAHCHNLQRINIVSRRSEPILNDRPDFNALKIKFCVSDVGLQYLSKCTALKEVVMNTILSKNFEGSMTLSGIRSLVKSLPKLERISYNDMGTVLVEGMEDVVSLPLLTLTCQSTIPNHIQAISRMCPNLNSLILHSPYSTFKDDYVEFKILQALTASSIRVSSLDLRKFQLSSALWDLLHSKGSLIKSLWLKLRSPVGAHDLERIGMTCPNLVSLHLFILAIDNPEYRYDPSRPLFRKLECLCLGVTWPNRMPRVSFSEICLSHALDIRHLVLLESQGMNDVNALWKRILQRNPLHALYHLIFNTEVPITWSTVVNILNSCPRLVVLNLPAPRENEEKQKFAKFEKSLNIGNLDLEFHLSETHL